MSLLSFDFECLACHHVYNDLVQGADGAPDPCPKCGHAEASRCFPMGRVFTVNIPDYPGAHRHMAGYAHIHNRPAEKAGRQVSVPRKIGVKS